MAEKVEDKIIALSKISLHENFQLRSPESLDLDELVNSIRQHGLIHPPTVRPVGKKYQLISGLRRFHALKKLKRTRARFSVRELSDEEAMSITLAENATRKDLTPIEEAKAFKKATEQVGMQAKKIAETIGRSEPYISNRLKLLELVPEAQEAIDKGKITPGHAEHGLFKLQEYPKLQKSLTKDVIKHDETAEWAENRAKSLLRERKTLEEFNEAKKRAKFRNCPKCGARPEGFDWSSRTSFRCSKSYSHTWDFMTGKSTAYDAGEYRRQAIKKAQEARKRMEAPRTAYFDTPLSKVKKLAHKKALEMLKKADPEKVSSITVHIHYPNYSSKGIEISHNVTFDVPGCATFHVEKKDNFVKTHIPYEEPKKKHYNDIVALLGFPEQVRHTGKPVKEGPGKVIPKDKAGKTGAKKNLKKPVLSSKLKEPAPKKSITRIVLDAKIAEKMKPGETREVRPGVTLTKPQEDDKPEEKLTLQQKVARTNKKIFGGSHDR